MSYRRELYDVTFDGVCEYAHFDSDGNLEGVEITDDVTTVLDNNQGLRNDGSNGYGESREMKQIASIPPSLVRQWEVEMGVPVNFLLTKAGFKDLIKKIYDPDYSKVRVDK